MGLKFSFRRFALRLAMMLLCCAPLAYGQFIGYTSPQTVNQSVFSLANCATSPFKSAPLTNVGQSVHIVSFALSSVGPLSGANGAAVRIMGSIDNSNFFQLSDDGMSGTNSVLVGYGSYPFIEIWVVGGTAGCTITAGYAGTSVSPPNNVGNADGTAFGKTIFASQAASGSQTIGSLVTPYGNTSGILMISSVLNGGPPAGSSVSVSIPVGTGSETIASFNLDTTNSPQTFVIPPYPAAAYNVTYTSGGASTSRLAVLYIFSKPGSSPVVPICEKTAIINLAAAGPTQIIAGVPGETVRVCSVSVSSGTAEAIDFQQGTGTNCGTNNSQLTGLYHAAANSPVIQNFPVGGLITLPSAAVCAHFSGANQTDGTITYSQY